MRSVSAEYDLQPRKSRPNGWLRVTLFLALCLPVFAALAERSGHVASPEAVAEFQSLLEASVASGVPGTSAAVVSGGRVIWTGTAGHADLQAGTQVCPDMLFGIGSITKVFVAVVVLQLMEEGRLRLDDTPTAILGEALAGIPNADTATIAQLLNHTSGIPSWEDDPAWIRDGRGASLDPARIWGKEETLAYIRGAPPLAAPGQRYSYANTNFTLLGMVIEQVTGRSAASEIRQRILAPLGLGGIFLEGFESVPQDRLPHRYHRATPEFREKAGVNIAFPEVRPGLVDASQSNLSVEWTAGGMVATPSDLALFGAALRDGRLLKADSMAFMQSWLPVNHRMQVGHNLFRLAFPDGSAPTVVGHDGGVLGFNAWLYWIEGKDIVLAVVDNAGAMHSGPALAAPGTRIIGRKDFIAAANRMVN